MLQQFVETDAFDALITHNRYTLVDRSASATTFAIRLDPDLPTI